MKRIFKIISILMVLGVILSGCSKKEEPETSAETLAGTQRISHSLAAAEPESPSYAADYTVYIPVFKDGEETDLYEIIGGRDCLIYVTKEGCDDCARDGGMIEKKMADSGMYSFLLHADKNPSKGTGLRIDTKVVKGMGLNAVPALCFVRDGRFISRIEDAFSSEGAEIDEMFEMVYGRKLGEEDVEKND